ncbi:tRNA processing endoribonuclease [Perkinsela sp. CCAP 1560/4]|nr:tRNA processing endoribonuclease [Perkinsela sp. CCAP 1560/4]|eukprot:KNH09754.1 tRNA processing endoribonuclease [Perkinsela sp. CCAP 1560/4]
MSITALGTDMPNTQEGFLITSDESYYLLRCPEGTQRHCVSRGLHYTRPGRLKLIIFTDMSPSDLMGFPSVYMALADSAALGDSCELDILTKDAESCALLQEWWKYCTIAFRSGCIKLNFCHTEWKDDHTNFVFQSSGILSIYLVGKKGTFLPEEAIKLGVNKQKFSLLHRGIPVHSDHAPWHVVSPREVTSPPQESCEIAYFPNVQIQESDLLTLDPNLIITTPQNLIFLQGDIPISAFEKNKHIDIWLVTSEKRRSCILPADCLQKILHRLEPSSFPMLNSSDDIDACPIIVKSSPVSSYRVTPGLTYEAYNTKKKRIGTFTAPCNLFHDIYEEINKNKVLPFAKRDSLETHKEHLLYVLGSGCAIPSVFRNVSCYLVSTEVLESPTLYVIDCGEGSLGQLSRIKDLSSFFLRFDAIVLAITHGHADHHFGSWSFLLYICSVRPELWKEGKIKIYVPEMLLPYAKWMLNFILRDRQLDLHGDVVSLPKAGGYIEAGLSCVPVIHTADPYGYIVTIGAKKIVFSGDTRPSDELIYAGKDAHLLVHEGTFLHSDAEDARSKMHSTITEALYVQRAMGAKNCLLTHFSQRYIKRIRELMTSAKQSPSAACAIDFLCVDLTSDLPAVLSSDKLAEAFEYVQKTIKVLKDQLS